MLTPTDAMSAPVAAAVDRVPSPGSRVAFVDNARAIGIVLVVAGHAPSLPGWISDFVFAFHMPLFFLLSGLMVGDERLKMSSLRRAALLARTLLLPYLFFFVLSYAYWLIAKRHGLRAQEFESLPWWDPMVGFFYGNADGLYCNVVLWFFPSLFITALAHHVVCKTLSTRGAALLFTCVAFAYVLLHDGTQVRWIWSADCAVIGVAFFGFGAALHATLMRRAPVQRRWVASLALVALATCYFLSTLTGHVDLNYLVFGAHPSLYLPMGAIGSVGVLALSALLPGSTVGRWLSLNTLVIFPLHFLMFSVVTGVAVTAMRLPAGFKLTSPWLALLYTAIALAMSWPAAAVIRRPLQALTRLGSR